MLIAWQEVQGTRHTALLVDKFGEKETVSSMESFARGLRTYRRRAVRALTASILLHAAGAMLLWFNQPPVTQTESPKSPNPASLVWIDIAAHSAVATPLIVPVVTAPLADTNRQRRATVPQTTRPRLNDAAKNPVEPQRSHALGPSDRPSRIDLAPRLDALDLPAFGGAAFDNVSSELPRLDSLGQEAALAEGTVKSLTQKAVIEARLNDGVVEPAVAALHAVLNTAVDEVPDSLDPQKLSERRKALKRSWQLGAERYGNKGSPYYESPQASDDGLPSEIRAAARTGNKKAIESTSLLYAGARLREFGQGLTDKPLMVTVSIDLAPQGLEAIKIVSGSGEPAFDAWVLTQASTAVRVHRETGNSLHPKSRVRSIWEYFGTVTYMRKKEKIGIDDMPYLALMTTSNLLTGTFDENSGKADYVDLRYPHYKCKAKLVATENLDD
jgi:hypothetical protein